LLLLASSLLQHAPIDTQCMVEKGRLLALFGHADLKSEQYSVFAHLPRTICHRSPYGGLGGHCTN
jgi:hypothetical protein